VGISLGVGECQKGVKHAKNQQNKSHFMVAMVQRRHGSNLQLATNIAFNKRTTRRARNKRPWAQPVANRKEGLDLALALALSLNLRGSEAAASSIDSQ